MSVIPDNMRDAAGRGFINATDLADYLVRKGLPFRDAYKISGKIVHDCISRGLVLETYPIEDYKQYSELFDEDVYEAIDLTNCVEKRISAGGPSVKSIENQLEYVKKIFE